MSARPVTYRNEGFLMQSNFTIEQRFWAKADKNGPVPDYAPSLGPCWLWAAGKDRYGYGQFSVAGHLVKTHRLAYELLVGPIPAGLQIDHLCRVRSCVNPDHMEPVSCRENVLRGAGVTAVNATKTKCPSSHEYSVANTYIYPDGSRKCLECNRLRSRERRRRLRAAVEETK